MESSEDSRTKGATEVKINTFNPGVQQRIERDGPVPTENPIPPPTNPMVTPLLTDMYQLTMAYAYWKAGKQEDNAVFDLLHRKNPFGGEYTVFAGLEECVKFAAHFSFSDDEIKYIRSILPARCEDEFFEYLRSVDCSQVEIHAIAEGSVVFPRVPLIRVEGPLLVNFGQRYPTSVAL